MRIGLVSTYVPFINGGARFIVEWAEEQLRLHGHEVERFYFPFVDDPKSIMDQIAVLRLVDLTQSCDRIICFRPPAHVIEHPNKVVWFIHHIRLFYDLWNSELSWLRDDGATRTFRRSLIDLDTRALGEARKIYTNSRVVADRLRDYNGIKATPLLPPVWQPERFRNDGYGDEIVCVCRVEPHKRQELLIEAMAHTKTDVRLRLCGEMKTPEYGEEVHKLIDRLGVRDKVTFDNRWITEEEKVERLATALAVAYIPADEDSYGYPSLEGAHAHKAVITGRDSGGTLELVEDGINGYVCEPTPEAVAGRMDELFGDRALAKRLGTRNLEKIDELGVSWPHVVAALTT